MVKTAWQPENMLDASDLGYAGEIPGCSVM